MFESDADRLALIEGLGGVAVVSPRGQFKGILDRPYQPVGDIPVESFDVMLTARTSDVTRLGVDHGVALTIGDEVFIVRSVRPDGLGMSELGLEA
jgi:hypothetical protein